MNIKNIIISIIIGLVVFAVGGGAGVMYQQQKENSKTQKKNSAPSQVNSKTISFIAASGKVVDINGRNVTITSSGDNLLIKIRDDAQINSVISPSEGKEAVFKKADFKDIKKGSNLDLYIRFLPDGQIEGYQVLLIM